MKLAVVRRVLHPGPARPSWAATLAVAGVLFVAVGLIVALGAIAVGPFRNADVLFAGITLALAGMVLCSITSPTDH